MGKLIWRMLFVYIARNGINTDILCLSGKPTNACGHIVPKLNEPWNFIYFFLGRVLCNAEKPLIVDGAWEQKGLREVSIGVIIYCGVQRVESSN